MFRRFGIKKGEHRESEARLRLQKELFAFNRCVEHGFPHKPSALAYDPFLKIMAIGTKTGTLKIFGRPGVEFTGQHDGDVSVTQLLFIPEQGRLLSLCGDNSLHLWEICDKHELSEINEVRKLTLENSAEAENPFESNKVKTISALCLYEDGSQLLLGTEAGCVHHLNIATFSITDNTIQQDVIMANVPDDFKVNPGAVEVITRHPSESSQFLFGFNRGLVVLWDMKEQQAKLTYNASQQLESLNWHRDGTQFMSAHSDGSYIVWSGTDAVRPKEQATTPYGEVICLWHRWGGEMGSSQHIKPEARVWCGDECLDQYPTSRPYPCKAINKIQWKASKADPFIIFSGGMPRTHCGDRNTVSVMQGGLHTVFDFTSRVVDFFVISSSDDLVDQDKVEFDNPQSLIVLTEEEIVGVDLESEGWQCYQLPYMCSLHSSAITCSNHISNIPETLWTKLNDAGQQQSSAVSTREWPIQGGRNMIADASPRDLLLTGHEDGSVRFWDCSSVSLKLLYKMTTANMFGDAAGADHSSGDADEEWPPFRKVGTFDPYSDDPRLALQKVLLCPLSETLVVGGTAGQVAVFQLERVQRQLTISVTPTNIVKDHDNFVWKGHESLPVRGGEIDFAAGFQPVSVMQLYPPAACTALALHSEWQLAAAGTAHGFAVVDYVQKKEVETKCTLNPNDMTGTADSAMSRRKSFKKSLRESFRRLRNRRSQAAGGRNKRHRGDDTHSTDRSEGGRSGGASIENSPRRADPGASPAAAAAEAGARPVERAIEARSTDDAMASMVRHIYFTDTFLLNAHDHQATMWVGTNAGTVYAYQIQLPPSEKREREQVTCQLAKEIQLKHRAPVLSICVIDRNAHPLPGALEVQHERAKPPDMTGSHQVVICSEEQFKLFTLPNLKAHHKHKLTAHEGTKVRKVSFINFRSRSDERYSESDLVCLTNQGEIQIFSMPGLRRQLKTDCIQKENVVGIVSSVFAANGEGFFLNSPSEFVRFSLSARFIPEPACRLTVAPIVRVELATPVTDVPDDCVLVETPEPERQPSPIVGEVDGAAGDTDSHRADDSVAEAGNDSLAQGDITVDSVKVHMSEESGRSMEVVESSSSVVTKTVVTRTVVSESTADGTVTSESTTVEQSTMSAGDPGVSDGGAASGGEN